MDKTRNPKDNKTVMDESTTRSAIPVGGHNLPRIPTMGKSPHKAVSKSSVKENKDDQSLKLLVEEPKRQDSPPCTPVKSEDCAKPPSSIPTPPSEPSPGDEKRLLTVSHDFAESDMVTSPVKCDAVINNLSPNVDNSLSMKNDNDSSLESEKASNSNDDTKTISIPCPNGIIESDNSETNKSPIQQKSSPKKGLCTTFQLKQNSSPRAKTKGDIKKQLQKKRDKKSEKTSVEEVTVPKTVDAQEDIAKATLAKRVVLLKDEAVAGAQHLLGDMFWGKVGSHPWWPCMVAYDPFEGVYFKLLKNTPQYHVQFFGAEEERAWVSGRRLVPYESRAAHLAWLEEMRKKAGKSDKKMYELNPRRRPAWEVACKESELAITMDRTARRAQFTLVYAEKSKEPDSPKKGSSKSNTGANKKRKLSHGGENNEKSPPRKKQKKNSSYTIEPIKIVNPAHIQYLVFCTKKRDSVRIEHPGYTDEKIDKILKERWNKLGEDERSKYIPMGADLKDLKSKFASSPKDSERRQSTTSKNKDDSGENAGIDTKRKRKSSQAADISADDSDLGEMIKLMTDGTGNIKDLSGISYVNGKILVEEKADYTKNKKKADDSNSQSSSTVESIPPNGQGVMLNGKYFEPEIFNLFANPSIKKETVCEMCEEDHGEMVTCEGVCQGSYHVTCLGLFKKPSGPFKCDACSLGTHSCFVCKKRENNPKKCASIQCGKFYHEECIKRYPNTRIENNRIFCPLHTCATCAATQDKDPKDQTATKGKMYRCVRCPTAYHASDFCVAAGSLNLAGQHIVCSNHFQPIKGLSAHTHINVSWCFFCSQGGSLICCESCPASYHAACLGIDPPEGAWHCRECDVGRKPLYGDIVWIKFGSYRWWPGEVCHPDNVPRNIQEKSHQVGEFVVRFFGTGEYTWLNQARVFLFQEGDKGNKDYASSRGGLDKGFRKSLEEANIAYKLVQEFKERKEEQKQTCLGKLPSKYRHIRTNRPVGDVQIYSVDMNELSRCDCDPESENPCGSDSDCVNRMTYDECNPAVCPAGKRCQNQRFVLREYPKASPFRFPNSAGWGLKTVEDIKKGQFVNEYVGDLIDEEECKRRIKQMHKDNIDDFYFLTLDKSRIIDAGPKGNLSRFMNHSCGPNCETQKWTVNGDTRVGLFAKQDIAAGSELTFNYNLDCLGNEKKKCNCGAKNCSGFLGVQPKNNVLEPVKIKKKKKRIPKVKKVYEDECYRCGYGGSLILCDKGVCPKVYHLKCLTLDKMPHGRWICPWHHCDDCGKAAIKFCQECPNSFCNKHIEGNIFKLSDTRLVCSDHEDLLETTEHTKLLNEPNSKAPSTSCSENGSSTAVSDSDGELTNGGSSTASGPLVKTVLKAQLEKKVAELKKREKEGEALSDSSVGGPPDENRMPMKKRASHRRALDDVFSPSSAPKIKSPRKQQQQGSTSSSSSSDTDVSTNGSVSSSPMTTKSPRRKSLNGRRSSSGKKAKLTPKMAGKDVAKSEPKVKAVIDEPMFDDTDSDDYPSLVIDIP